MVRRMQQTAIELLKANSSTLAALYTEQSTFEGVLRQTMDDKGYPHKAVAKLAQDGHLGPLMQVLVLRTSTGSNSRYGKQSVREISDIVNAFGASIGDHTPAETEQYRGNANQLQRIDRALSFRKASHEIPVSFGESATNNFGFQSKFVDLADRTLRTPIAIIGYGAAGILVHFALRELGFQNITMFEKQKESLGIWNRDNVYKGSRNNPFTLDFFDETLVAAPGGGEEVKEFLERLSENTAPQQAEIERVSPGNLRHTLTVQGLKQQFPIVINAMGLGAPVPLSDPERMTTMASISEAGPRWQKTLDARRVEGHRLVFIGLGNSTAEMLRQVHELQDKGVDVDYRVLTHYPREAVYNPSCGVTVDGKPYRVFRDLTQPNLVDYQGDLDESRYDYGRALNAGKILWGVRRWVVQDGTLGAINAKGRVISTVDYNSIFTLTGYRHTQDSLEAMGCTWDTENGCGLFDYDGEMVRNPKATAAEDRLHKGYFGFGAVLDAPHNRNAIVIPGMLHRLGDLLFGVVMRATEFQQTRA